MTQHVDEMPTHLGVLRQRNTNHAIISRAPYEKIAAFQKRMDWPYTWVSSYGSDFNYDFNATITEKAAPGAYDYQSNGPAVGEQSELSVFYRGDDGGMYHSYSCFGRGMDQLLVSLQLLDQTPLGRQHQPGPPGGMKYHDEFED